MPTVIERKIKIKALYLIGIKRLYQSRRKSIVIKL